MPNWWRSPPGISIRPASATPPAFNGSKRRHGSAVRSSQPRRRRWRRRAPPAAVRDLRRSRGRPRRACRMPLRSARQWGAERRPPSRPIVLREAFGSSARSRRSSLSVASATTRTCLGSDTSLERHRPLGSFHNRVTNKEHRRQPDKRPRRDSSHTHSSGMTPEEVRLDVAEADESPLVCQSLPRKCPWQLSGPNRRPRNGVVRCRGI